VYHPAQDISLHVRATVLSGHWADLFKAKLKSNYSEKPVKLIHTFFLSRLLCVQVGHFLHLFIVESQDGIAQFRYNFLNILRGHDNTRFIEPRSIRLSSFRFFFFKT
jgi:hypothetical protein